MTREEYDRIDAVNWSTLRAMRASPKHYRYAAEDAAEARAEAARERQRLGVDG